MKRNRVTTVAIIAIFGLVLFLGRLAAQGVSANPAPPTTIRTGVCDLAQVLNRCQEAKDRFEAMTQSRTKLQGEGDARREAIATMQKEIQPYKPGSDVYEDKFAKIQEEIEGAKMWAAVETNKLQRRYRRETAELYEAALLAIQAIAEAQGFHLIVSNAVPELGGSAPDKLKAAISQRRVLYQIPEIDITPAVLARLDEEYRAKSR